MEANKEQKLEETREATAGESYTKPCVQRTQKLSQVTGLPASSNPV